MIWTKDQEQAGNKLVDWLNVVPKKQDDYFYTLAGFAGTGKSTLLDDVLKQTTKNDVCVSATTHKAKKVIEQKTGLPGETAQALMGLRMDVELKDFNPNKPQFNNKGDEKISRYKVVCVDEASMMGKKATDLFVKTALKYRTKVLFIGDKYQLPPIQERISKVFLMPNVVHLEEVVRQAGDNPNSHIITLARNDVKNGTDMLSKYFKSIKHDYNNRGEGFKVLGREQFYPEILTHFYDSQFAINPEYAKIIASYNDTVGGINRYIRSKLTDSKEYITKGDMLMGYSNISIQIEGPPYYIPVVSNSEDYYVESAELIEIPIEGIVYKGYKTRLVGHHFPLFILHPSSYPAFQEEHDRRIAKASEDGKWPAYYRFRNQIQLMWDIVAKNDPSKILVSKDIDYGYAITVHKSQGSTYNHVGLVMADIARKYDPQERRQLAYVGISRTSNTNDIY